MQAHRYDILIALPGTRAADRDRQRARRDLHSFVLEPSEQPFRRQPVRIKLDLHTLPRRQLGPVSFCQVLHHLSFFLDIGQNLC